jgi:hypothetical protein
VTVLNLLMDLRQRPTAGVPPLSGKHTLQHWANIKALPVQAA